jgi:hypothetical protein
MVLILILLAGVLAGCGSEAASADSTSGQTAGAAVTPQPYTSSVLGTSYQGALPASTQLALGTLKLEGTPDAVTPDQARMLLPFWQAIQGGGAQSDAEVNAVLKQIEGKMQPEQLKAIAAMQLTMQDLTDYAQANNLAMGGPPGAMGGAPPAGGGQAPQGFGNLTDAERQAFQATAEAGGFGGGPGGQGPGNPGGMSDAQRQAFRATAEAGGMPAGGPRGGGGGAGFLTALARPLVDLLTQRAAQ